MTPDLKAMRDAVDTLEDQVSTCKETEILRSGIKAMAADLSVKSDALTAAESRVDVFRSLNANAEKRMEEAESALAQAKEDTLKRVLSVMDKTATLLNDRDFANNPYRRAITDELAATDAASQGEKGDE